MTPSARPPDNSAIADTELLPSIGSSAGSIPVFAASIPYNLISLVSSLIVRTESTSLIPLRIIPSRLASNFIAVHGVTETEKIFSGLTDDCPATIVLIRAPAICCGDFTVDRLGMTDGMNCSAYLTQAGQALIYSGLSLFLPAFSISWSVSSDIPGPQL